MKLGRMLTRGLGAAMTGYGKTLLDQDAREQKQRELDGVMMREQALATFNHGLALDTIGATAAANVAQTNATEQIKTREEGLRLAPATDAKIRADTAHVAAEADAEYKLLPAKTRATLTIEEYRQNRLDARESLDRASREGIAKAGRDENVVATGVDANGDVTVTKGNDSHVTFRGMKPTPRGKSGDDEPVTLQSARGGGARPAATPTAPVDAKAQLAADKAHLATVYPNATPQTYPGFFRDGRKLPMDELAKALEDDYGN